MAATMRSALSVASTTNNSINSAEFSPEVGTNGHTASTPFSAPSFQAHARETLEVSRLGTDWAQQGISGQLAPRLIVRNLNIPESATTNQYAGVTRAPVRARMWKFSIPLQHPETGRPLVDLDRLRSGLDRKSISRFMWLVHDKDAGSAPHLQGCLRLANSRVRELLASVTGLSPAAFKPLVDTSGQHGAFERYCRYLLHEGPESQADGKFHYPDSDAHANFDFREMIDRYFGYAASAPIVSADQIKLMALRGEISPAEVEATFPMVYIRHFKTIEILHEKGREERRKRAEDLEHAARQEEADSRETLEQARRQHLSARGFNDVEVELAIKEGLAEDALLLRSAEAERHAAERRRFEDRAATERKRQEERTRSERQSPEYQARMEREAIEEERQLIVAAVAMQLDIRGDAKARDAGVLRRASAEEFTSRAYAPGDALSIDEARDYYVEVLELVVHSPEDRTAKIREDIALLKGDLARAPQDISIAEYHAADGNLASFERALDRRAMYAGYPDLVTLPSPRTDLSKKQQAQLLEAA
jgi:hypothetical protein